MRTATLTLCVIAACGGTGATSDGKAVDAVGTPGDGAAIDAKPQAVDDVQCQTHTVTTTNADGSTTIFDQKFGVVDGIDPASDYVLEICDESETVTTPNGTQVIPLTGGASDPACPAGATCVDSGAAFPTFQHACTWNHGATFVDAHLFVSCGQKNSSFDKTGVLIVSVDFSIGAIRVHH
jgi:hypothetical protein